LGLAKEILEEAGWNDEDGDGWREKTLPPDEEEPITLKIKLLVPSRGRLPELAEDLKERWAEIGVDTEIESVAINIAQQNQIKNREYEALIFGQALSLNPDPYIFWHSLRKKEGLNFAIYDNADVDEILNNIRRVVDNEEYKNNLIKFQELIIDDIPAIFLYNPNYLYAIAKQVKGIDLNIASNSSQRFTDINTWYLETKRVRKSNLE